MLTRDVGKYELRTVRTKVDVFYKKEDGGHAFMDRFDSEKEALDWIAEGTEADDGVAVDDADDFTKIPRVE